MFIEAAFTIIIIMIMTGLRHMVHLFLGPAILIRLARRLMALLVTHSLLRLDVAVVQEGYKSASI